MESLVLGTIWHDGIIDEAFEGELKEQIKRNTGDHDADDVTKSEL